MEKDMNKTDLLVFAFAAFLLVGTTGDAGMTSQPTLNFDGGGGRPCTSSNLPVCPPGSQEKDQPYFASSFSTSESVITTHTRAV